MDTSTEDNDMSSDPIWTGRAPRPAPLYPLSIFLWPLLAVLAIVVVILWIYRPGSWSAQDPNAKPRPVADRGPLDEEEQKTIALYKSVRPSVVHVTRLSVQRDFSTMDLEQI